MRVRGVKPVDDDNRRLIINRIHHPFCPPSQSNIPSMATIKGELGIFPVSPDRKHPYFISGDLSSTKALIFIGGLFNGMSDVPYLPALSEALGTAGWKL